MEQRELAVVTRTASGTGAARRLRRQGLVPAILYGRGGESVSLAVDAKVVRELLHSAGHNVLLRLKINDGGDEAPTVMLREIQRHSLTGGLLNVDFQRISLTERITARVAVTLVGEAPGLKQFGLLDHILREIEVEALPAELPERLELDVSSLEIGQSLHISDLAPPEGVTITADAGDVVVTMTVPRAVEEAVPAAAAAPAEGAEAAEGEEAAEPEEAEEG